MSSTPRILVIAGSDSSGGAGIQADIKTITMLGGHAMTAITAITAQNTCGVTAVEVLSPDMVAAQIAACLSDIGADAVKIGMLGSAAVAHRVADLLESANLPVVFDPVMVATSGATLADPATITAFGRLMALATLVTPNLPELASLGGEAAVLATARHLLVKGGHGDGATVVDRLVGCEGELARWESPRLATRHTHGTGCTLASAIACGLGAGLELAPAIERARSFVWLALKDAPGLGQGAGPLGQQNVRLDAQAGPCLNQVTLPARDLAVSVAFYRELGLTLRVLSEGNGYARFACPGGATLSLDCAAQGPAAAVFFECADLDQRVAALRADGFAIEAPADQPWLWREAWLHDPAGNRLCLYRAGVNRRWPPWALDEGENNDG
ncbi:MAG: bifunctional hydroxymethylpyrimidine kinase/phosphomethylpyrimidine kinase [Proteobacteria bacterium]|nr:bifunctional hydroxymethylpyrimidine kinase/phosphomethylpyrimidine kinase [Pseudomonadota bacterium]